MSLVVSAPLSNQIQGPFIDTRRVYEIRERPSRMYSWTALITSQILGELPLNIVGSSLFFLIWYWLVGFPSSRAGYSYLMFGIMYPMYYTTFSLWVAAISPNAEIAAQLFSFFFSFVVTLSVVLYFTPYTWTRADLILATAYCSHTSTLAGGSGCIARHLTLTSSKD
jgi:ATP-binding cassette subfamily G (WHITE) protein 2 (SNQ2)